MTSSQEPQDRIRTEQPHQPPSSRPAQTQGHTNTSPELVDEGTVFTRAALQTTQLLELPAELRNRLMGGLGQKQPAAVVAEANPYRGHTVLLDARTLRRALEPEGSIRPVEPARATLAGLGGAATVCDGGALREHALKLAQELASAAARETTPAREESAVESPLAAPGPTPPARASGLGTVASAWRQASLVRRVTAVLLPVAALATLWPDDDAEARSGARVASSFSKPARAPALSDSAAPTLSAAHAAELPNVPTEAGGPAAIEASATQRLIEAQALKAAFSGDTATAARHYERLARERKDPRFELALRLVKREAMRRP
jgi:hypothetical protein